MSGYLVSAPTRFGPPSGFGSAWNTPGGVRLGVHATTGYGSPGDLGSSFSSAWSGFLASGLSVAQVALGAVLLLAALGIVISQTAAGQTAGSVGAGAARRGLRAIPGVGLAA